jgi:thymidylate synthase
MYTAVPPQPTNAQAWLAAAAAVQGAGGEAYNVIIDIADPLAVAGPDDDILMAVDQFLREHHVNTLAGVANTIFPQRLLDRHGAAGLYKAYNQVVLPRMKQMTHDWGRYFERMTAWRKIKGKEVVIINPLDDLIRFMRDQIASQRTYRNAYEMTIFDPTRDAGKVSNRQCLSFLSFKLTVNNILLLTAIYRNHAYVARGLGNFLGLGRLQAFVAAQSGAKLGSLTCISTHAEIDAGKKTQNGVVQGWTRSEANALIIKCGGFVQQLVAAGGGNAEIMNGQATAQIGSPAG